MKTDDVGSIVLVADHTVIATSLTMALAASGFRLATAVGADDLTVEEVLDVARSVQADLALIDLRTRGRLSLDLIGPLVALGSKVLLFANTDDRELITGGLMAGAEAIVDRAMSFERLVATLIELVQGRELMTAEERSALVQALLDRDGDAHTASRAFEALTAREAFVLRNLVGGRSPKEIAHVERLSISTVRGHIERIFVKLDVRSQREALALARKVGWPEAMEPGARFSVGPGNIPRSHERWPTGRLPAVE